MHRLAVLASVVMVAVSSVSCANSPERPNANSLLAPSALDGGAITSAKGGGGKPGGGGTSGGGSLMWVMVTDNNHDGVPSFTDTITFAVQTTATTKPWVTVRCRQNGTLVLQDSNGIFATSLDQDFTLGPTSVWTSGSADCTATLENWDSYSKNGSITVLASLSFTAN